MSASAIKTDSETLSWRAGGGFSLCDVRFCVYTSYRLASDDQPFTFIPAMTGLKPLDQISEPDPRHAYIALFAFERETPRPRSLEALHAVLERLEPQPYVPELVRKRFDTARNLVLYSWFVYEFSITAELHAYGCVELALRERAGGTLGRNLGLKKLLTHAITEDWIRDTGFRFWRERVAEWESGAEYRTMLEEDGFRFEPFPTDPHHYAKILADALPALRNHMAHGEGGMLRHALRTLVLCIDILDQVFAPTSPPDLDDPEMA